MAPADYTTEITAIIDILKRSSDKLRVPTSAEVRLRQKRTLRLMWSWAGFFIATVVFSFLSEYLSHPTARFGCRIAMVGTSLGGLVSILLAALPEMWRMRKEFTSPVNSQLDTIVATLPSESEVVGELLQFEKNALLLTADRLDYEVSKINSRTSIVIDTQSATFITIVAYAYYTFNLVRETGLMQMSVTTAGAMFVMVWYFAALFTKGTLGVLEYQAKFVRMVGELKSDADKAPV